MTGSKLKPLAEQVIVITGASSGIGLVTARTAAATAKVMLVGTRWRYAGADRGEIGSAGVLCRRRRGRGGGARRRGAGGGAVRADRYLGAFAPASRSTARCSTRRATSTNACSAPIISALFTVAAPPSRTWRRAVR
ncbi:hypothetical protein AB5I41_25795 [Sphingomonas sp. MMS24-JH45]